MEQNHVIIPLCTLVYGVVAVKGPEAYILHVRLLP